MDRVCSLPEEGPPGTWFSLILVPSSSFIPIADAAFEHRMYLPLAGVIVLAKVIRGRLELYRAGRPCRERPEEAKPFLEGEKR